MLHEQLRAEIKHVTIHELLHALVMMKHRADLFSVMYPGGSFRLARLSDSDEALLRLYAHPLVRHGMTMPEVRQLIVFADELLDPPGGVGFTQQQQRGLSPVNNLYGNYT